MKIAEFANSADSDEAAHYVSPHLEPPFAIYFLLNDLDRMKHFLNFADINFVFCLLVLWGLITGTSYLTNVSTAQTCQAWSENLIPSETVI